MALRAMYKGFKKVLAPLIINRPGVLAIDQDALNTELNSVFFPRSEQAVLGAVNALDTSLDALKRINTSGTWSGNAYTLDGVTFTVADDGKITANNESTNIVYFNLDTNFDTAKYAGWKMNGLPSNGGNNTFMFRISASTADRTGIQDFESSADTDITNNGSGKCLAIRIANGYNPDNKVFAPMVSLSGGAFVPFAMTNKELTASSRHIQSVNIGNRSTCKIVPTDFTNQQIFLIATSGSAPVLNGLFLATVYGNKTALITEISPTSGSTVVVNSDGELEITTGSAVYRRIMVVSSADFSIV